MAGLGDRMERLSGGGGGRTCYVMICYDVFVDYILSDDCIMGMSPNDDLYDSVFTM